ncbi:hypothetical protein E3E14_27895 [Streptomyces sp. ICN441]|uniref:tRNA adenosine deaminase-associated protein n=1 Tax=Streptomyces sp. ICN441 TaxID=2558286 RepID=UPI00106C7CF3|nr:hypothetical protein [Streptomyces sp. ICN441]TFE38602.1 hypothetical protein E3E14_27895 [Streptomyces sp. ICN441]
MYFAALLARTEDGWVASDTELDDVESLSDLADLARDASVNEDTVLAFIEQEDTWFGIVRVDGEDDPRVFVSDAASAARSSYGAMLTDELLGKDEEDDELESLDLDGTEDGEPESEEEPSEDSETVPSGPLGDSDLLADLGMSAKELCALSSEALTEIADTLGASEILEAVR